VVSDCLPPCALDSPKKVLLPQLDWKVASDLAFVYFILLLCSLIPPDICEEQPARYHFEIVLQVTPKSGLSGMIADLRYCKRVPMKRTRHSWRSDNRPAIIKTADLATLELAQMGTST